MMALTKNKLLVGLAAIVAAIGLATIGGYYGVQETTAFEIGQQRVLDLAESKKLGEPVSAKLRPFGYAMRVSGSSGTADFAFDLTGQQGKAIAYVLLRKEVGQWTVVDARVARAGDKKFQRP